MSERSSMQALPVLLSLSEKVCGLGSWVYNCSDGSYWFSKNIKELLGLRTDPTSLEDVCKLVNTKELPLLSETLDALHNCKPVPEGEFTVMKSGEVVHVRQHASYYEEAGVQYKVGTWQDITKEKIQRERVHFFDELIDASIDGIMAMDNGLNIILWNRRNEIFNEKTKDEVMGKNIFEVKPWFADSVIVSEALQHALQGYASFIPAGKYKEEKGYYEDHFLPLRNLHNEVIGVLNIRHDVAHRVKAENELKELNRSLAHNNKQLKQRNAELQIYSHITSHDFKDPLRRVYTSVEMLLNQEAGNFSEKGKQYFKQIQGSVQRIGLLSDDILSYSRLDDQATAFEKVDLNEVMELSLKRLDEKIKQTNAKIIHSSLPEMNGHKLMLLQLFYNLLSNALKFQEEGNTPAINIEGTVEPGTSVDHPDADPLLEYVKISFTDNGIGLKRKYYDKIFEVFMRINKTRYPGGGTGLALARKIAELHNGFITVESVPGEGSTFHCFVQKNL